MTHRLEFYFDCSSPWTYLAFERALTMFDRTAVDIVWKPILVGGVFNEVNAVVYEIRANPIAPKLAYQQKDLQDWAKVAGISIGDPPVFPVNSVKAMRGAFFALDEGCLEPYAQAVFKSYWSDLNDISQDEVLASITAEVGLSESAFFDAISNQQYKDRLRATTSELIERGGFGSPTLFLDGNDMYFGNDRLELISYRLAR